MYTYNLNENEIRFNENERTLEIWKIADNKIVWTFYLGEGESEVKIALEGDSVLIEEYPQSLEEDQFMLDDVTLTFTRGGGILTIDIRDSMRTTEDLPSIQYQLDPDDSSKHVRLHSGMRNRMVIRFFE